MNSLQQAREQMRLTEEEFALLLGWPPEAVPELEAEPEFALGTLRPLFMLLAKSPQHCAQLLIEERLARLPTASPDREPLAALVRKIHGCSVA